MTIMPFYCGVKLEEDNVQVTHRQVTQTYKQTNENIVVESRKMYVSAPLTETQTCHTHMHTYIRKYHNTKTQNLKPRTY